MPNWQHHFTREETQTHVADALAIIEATDPPDDLRQAAFAFALNALSTKSATQPQAVPFMLDPRLNSR